MSRTDKRGDDDPAGAMELTHDDVKRILEIIDSAEHLDEIELVYGGFHLRVHRGATSAALPRQPAVPTLAPSSKPLPETTSRPTARPEQPLGEGEVAIRAPMLGTFYRSPAPGEPPFVEVGQRVRADDTVCLIEVMKLFSSIKAGVDGVVKQIIPDNGSLVEFNQLLIVVATVT
jgi:acetyl-CoA carboxylase biotin carboxyl carrier protein